MTEFIFGVLAIFTVLCALMVVFSKNAIHSVLYLILTFFTIAAHYIMLNAQFLAIVHIIVYAGAIMVLFLFTVMLLNLNKDNEPQKDLYMKAIAVVSGGLFLIALVSLSKGLIQGDSELVKVNDIGMVKNLGTILFDKYVLPFEISSILFISAIAGAIVLTKKENNTLG